MADPDLIRTAESWIADDPDPGDRRELAGLLARARASAAAAEAAEAEAAAAELADRFAGRLRFGTAGLRGVMAAGPNRMNRAMVRMVSAAVAGWLSDGGASLTQTGPSMGIADSDRPHATGLARPAGEASVALGCDARHRSAEFAGEAAAVFAGAGIRVHLLPLPCPTPLLAFAVRHLAADAGVMITASHNPAADNGYKLYMSDGAQVIPPADGEVEERMSRVGPLAEVPLADQDSPLITRHGDEVAQAYLAAVAGPPASGSPQKPRVVYTPMHGVAGPLLLRAVRQAGFEDPIVVAAQAEPDPDFPTLAFPNPEEPGALDLAIATAAEADADLVLASDPDGDRLAVAVPDPGAGGQWRRFTGDQVGALLGAYLLRTSHGPGQPLVAASIVSSSLLAKIAVASGARFAATLTGFKWIARAADAVPGARFVFGYEEAIGYQVGTVVRDKDGIGAALAVLRLAASGPGLVAEYDQLERLHGVHRTAQISVRGGAPAEVMTRLREDPVTELAGSAITDVADHLPASDVLVYSTPVARVAIRPSGTEPKLKAYLEVVVGVGDGLQAGEAGLEAARGEADARMADLLTATRQLIESRA
jgi:phosphomannomutase